MELWMRVVLSLLLGFGTMAILEAMDISLWYSLIGFIIGFAIDVFLPDGDFGDFDGEDHGW